MGNSEVYGKFVLTVYASNILIFDFIVQFCLAIKKFYLFLRKLKMKRRPNCFNEYL